MNSRAFLEKLTASHLEDFPVRDLNENRRIKVEEHYIPASTEIFFYGILHKFNLEDPPQDLFNQVNNKKAIHSESAYALTPSDWQEIIETSSGNNIKILSADYSPDSYIENLIISIKGDSNLQLRSYIGIFFCLLAIILLILIYLLLVSKTYPDLAEQMETFLHLSFPKNK